MLLFGLLLGLAFWPRKRPDWGDGWVFPVPDIEGAGDQGIARVTNSFVPDKHNGVDIMYLRVVGDPNAPGSTQAVYFAPRGTPVLAARAGTVWSVSLSPRGWQVVLDHGAPWATYYQHLAEKPLLAKGDRVAAGQQIGVMGSDPTDPQGLRHLHFEAWYKGSASAAVDPGKEVATWPHLTWDAGPQADWDTTTP